MNDGFDCVVKYLEDKRSMRIVPMATGLPTTSRPVFYCGGCGLPYYAPPPNCDLCACPEYSEDAEWVADKIRREGILSPANDYRRYLASIDPDPRPRIVERNGSYWVWKE